MLELVLRGSWEALRSLNKEIPCYGLTRNFLVGRQVGPQVGAMLKLVLGGFLERSWEGFGGVLGWPWGVLGTSWGVLGRVLGRLRMNPQDGTKLVLVLGGLGGVLGCLRTFWAQEGPKMDPQR